MKIHKYSSRDYIGAYCFNLNVFSADQLIINFEQAGVTKITQEDLTQVSADLLFIGPTFKIFGFCAYGSLIADYKKELITPREWPKFYKEFKLKGKTWLKVQHQI